MKRKAPLIVFCFIVVLAVLITGLISRKINTNHEEGNNIPETIPLKIENEQTANLGTDSPQNQTECEEDKLHAINKQPDVDNSETGKKTNSKKTTNKENSEYRKEPEKSEPKETQPKPTEAQPKPVETQPKPTETYPIPVETQPEPSIQPTGPIVQGDEDQCANMLEPIWE